MQCLIIKKKKVKERKKKMSVQTLLQIFFPHPQRFERLLKGKKGERKNFKRKVTQIIILVKGKS